MLAEKSRLFMISWEICPLIQREGSQSNQTHRKIKKDKPISHIYPLIQREGSQNNQTQRKIKKTNPKNIINPIHPTPCRSAILPIRLTVPAKNTLVFAKPSFILSINPVESLISSPIFTVTYHSVPVF